MKVKLKDTNVHIKYISLQITWDPLVNKDSLYHQLLGADGAGTPVRIAYRKDQYDPNR